MNEIICECGHKITSHDYNGCDKCDEDCYLSRQAVEARYWARRAYKRYNQLLDENYRLSNNCDALQAKLDEAIEMYEEAVSIIDNGNMDDDDIQIIHDNLVKIRGDK